MKNTFHDFENLFLWVVGGIIAISTWIVRNIFTNTKKIEILEQQIKSHSKLRQEDHETINQVMNNISEIKNFLMSNH